MANLNTRFTGDATGINDASKQARKAVRDFSQTSEKALSALGNSLGVDTGKISQLTSAAQGLGLKLSQSANSGAAAFGKLLGSISAVGAGIAGLGITAAALAFKQLHAEAENFRQTVEGTNMALQTQAYIDTYRQVMHDLNKEQGRSVAQLEDRLRIFAAQAKSISAQFFLNATGTMSGALTGTLDISFWKRLLQQNAYAKGQAEQAKKLQGEIYELELKRSQSARVWAEMEAEASRLKNVSLDRSKSQVERAEALRRAEELIRQIYTERYDIEIAIADRMDATNNLAASSKEQITAANTQRENANRLIAQMEQSLTRIISRQQSLTSATGETNKALEKQLDLIIQARADRNIRDIDVSGASLSGVKPIASGAQLTPKLAGFDFSEASLPRIKDYSQEMTSIVQDNVEQMSIAIGELVGDLATGGNAWQNFGNTAIAAFADMMQSIGKLVIKEGIAVSAVWKSLSNPANAPLAIAAGVALVGIGAAIKAGLSNIAQGSGYGASGYVASSGYSSGGSSGLQNLSEREIQVHVTGTLQASGSTLQAVLDNNNRRLKSTT